MCFSSSLYVCLVLAQFILTLENCVFDMIINIHGGVLQAFLKALLKRHLLYVL